MWAFAQKTRFAEIKIAAFCGVLLGTSTLSMKFVCDTLACTTGFYGEDGTDIEMVHSCGSGITVAHQ